MNSNSTDTSKKLTVWRKDRGGKGAELAIQNTVRRREDSAEIERALADDSAELEALAREDEIRSTRFEYGDVTTGFAAFEITDRDDWREYLNRRDDGDLEIIELSRVTVEEFYV